MSWETTSDSTNTEFRSDNNYNFNFVKVQTFNSPNPGTQNTMNKSESRRCKWLAAVSKC